MPKERLQKILARGGVASRRTAERFIAEGRVRVNGRIVRELGTRADAAHDRVELDGKRLVAEEPIYYLLHKPREVVTTLSDPEGRPTIADLVKRIKTRVYPVGRLDYHTSGALLLTNDGEMTEALLHPRKRVPKVYVAKLKGSLSLHDLQLLREGVVLDDGYKTGQADVFVTREEHGNTWLQITITEGKNRQVHRMAEAIGHRVMRLFRLSFAGLSADGLRPGELRALRESEIAKLKRDYLTPSQRDKRERARARRRAALDAGAMLEGAGRADEDPVWGGRRTNRRREPAESSRATRSPTPPPAPSRRAPASQRKRNRRTPAPGRNRRTAGRP